MAFAAHEYDGNGDCGGTGKANDDDLRCADRLFGGSRGVGFIGCQKIVGVVLVIGRGFGGNVTEFSLGEDVEVELIAVYAVTVIDEGALDGGKVFASEIARVGQGVGHANLFAKIRAHGNKVHEEKLVRTAVAEEFSVGGVVDEIFDGGIDFSLFKDAYVICIGNEKKAILLVCARVKPYVLLADGVSCI